MSEDISIHALLARIDERTENTMHRLRNMEAKMEAQALQFIPRKEVEATTAAIDNRVSKLEETQRKVAWAIITAWIGGLGTVGAMIARKL